MHMCVLEPITHGFEHEPQQTLALPQLEGELHRAVRVRVVSTRDTD